MAFPTSGLVNNQVHTESGQNRSWVYDSTLAVWNQLREAPDTISILGGDKAIDNVTLGSSAVFPVGHVLQVKYSSSTTAATGSDDSWVNAVADTITFTGGSNSKLLAIATVRGEARKTSAGAMGGIRMLTSGTSVTAETHDPNVTDASGPYGILGVADTRLAFTYSISFLFTPAHDGAITVTAQGRRYGANHSFYINLADPAGKNSGSELILMEIAT